MFLYVIAALALTFNVESTFVLEITILVFETGLKYAKVVKIYYYTGSPQENDDQTGDR